LLTKLLFNILKILFDKLGKII